MKRKIEFHADDFGLTVPQSARIIECIDNGAVNGVSLMPNSPCLSECMDLLGKRDVYKTVHLNLVQGKPFTKARHLTKDGVFNISFGKLLVVSYIPFLRRIYRKEIKKEFIKQLEATYKYMDNGRFRLDSHWHFHLLPVVFDGMMDAVDSLGAKVEYIRLPADKISFFFQKGKRERVKPINIVKVLILNTLRVRTKLFYGKRLSKMEQRDFFGVMYSGNMNPVNTEYIMKNLDPDKAYEILFHPGSVLEDDGIQTLTSDGDRQFLTSPNREKEALATKSLMP